MHTVQWTEGYAYVGTHPNNDMELTKYDTAYFNQVAQVVLENSWAHAMREYGNDHFIVLGISYKDDVVISQTSFAILFQTSGTMFNLKMRYEILPDDNIGRASAPYFEIYRTHLNVDYPNRLAVFEVYSIEQAPSNYRKQGTFSKGFYYLHIEVDSGNDQDCLIHPPISQCDMPIGQ